MEKYLIRDFANGNDEAVNVNGRTFAKAYGREPILAKMPDGTLICMFTTGGPTEPHNENITVYSKSSDGGKTWTDCGTIFKNKNRGCWCTEIFTEGSAPFTVVSTYNALCPFKELQTFISYTYDNGKTWTTPTHMHPLVNTVSFRKGIKMSNGEWLFPVYWTVARDCFEWEEDDYYKDDWWQGTAHESGVAITSDGGKSFERCGRHIADYSVWEPTAIELEEGHILMFCRDKHFLGRTESFDFGRTWTEYEVSDIPNPSSKMDLVKANGKVILINNFDENDRKKLEIAISDNNAKTWREARIPVDSTEEEFLYPHSIADDENQILYVAYENYKQHYLKKFTYEELGIL